MLLFLVSKQRCTQYFGKGACLKDYQPVVCKYHTIPCSIATMSRLALARCYDSHNKFRHHKHLYKQIISLIHYNALIHHRNGPPLPALNFQRKQNDGSHIHWDTCRLHQLDKSSDSFTFSSLLQVCNSITTLQKVHAQIIATGFEQNVFLSSKIINMYSLWGCVKDARKVFDKMRQRNVFIWNVMIRGYAMNGSCDEALAIYCQMKQAGIQPDDFTFTFILKACAELFALQEGKEIHGHIVKVGSELNVFVGNSLVYMYVKCGVVEHARRVFERIPEKDVVSWNAVITGYAQNGYEVEALGFFNQMQLVGMKHNSVTMVSVIQACAHLGILIPGKLFHNHAIKGGFEADVILGNSLIDMYANCGCMDSAQRIFNKMLDRNVISWSALIAGYAQNGLANEALLLFDRMQKVDVVPNSVTIVIVLQACTRFGDLQQGKLIHDYVVQRGLDLDVFVVNSLMHMFANIGSIDVAQNLFDRMSTRNVVSWNIMIAGYSHNRCPKETLLLFNKMQLAKMQPNPTTIVNVLQVFTSLVALQQGMWIHSYVIKHGYESDIFVGNSLIDMYAKCGRIDSASQLFGMMTKRDVVSWSTMISAHGMHGYGKDALALFQQMQRTGIKPNHIIFVGVLSACSHSGLVDEGRKYFNSMIQDYCITPKVEHYACMVDLLCRAGYLYEAHDFIKKMPMEPSASVWGALLSACRTYCNVELGEWTANQLICIDPQNVGCYIILSNIYAAAGKWDDVAVVKKLLKDNGLKKLPACSMIDVNNSVNEFFMGYRSHRQSENYYDLLENLAQKMKTDDSVHATEFMVHNVDEVVKRQMSSGYNERPSIVSGLSLSFGSPAQIMKSLHM